MKLISGTTTYGISNLSSLLRLKNNQNRTEPMNVLLKLLDFFREEDLELTKFQSPSAPIEPESVDCSGLS